jgi:hypothetical protein
MAAVSWREHDQFFAMQVLETFSDVVFQFSGGTLVLCRQGSDNFSQGGFAINGPQPRALSRSGSKFLQDKAGPLPQ